MNGGGTVNWDEDKRGIDPDEFDILLESIHIAQSPSEFSETAAKIGWREQPMPAGFTQRIMARIREEAEEKAIDWWILGVSFGLLALFGLLIPISVGHMMGLSGPMDYSQAVSGIFWLVIGLGMSLGIASVTVLTSGRRRYPSPVGNKGGF